MASSLRITYATTGYNVYVNDSETPVNGETLVTGTEYALESLTAGTEYSVEL
ncbi:MAG: hypothetical protein ACLVAT_00370 [Lachnospiraceae bacterium]